jgi:hypothetical protein
MLLIDHLLEALAGPLTGLNAWHTLAKETAAIPAAAFAHRQIQDATPKAPVIMPHLPPAPAFVAQTRTAALGARYRPGVPGRYRNGAAAAFDRGNLVLGQAQQDLRIGQNVISQDCFTNLGSGLAPVFDQEPFNAGLTQHAVCLSCVLASFFIANYSSLTKFPLP